MDRKLESREYLAIKTWRVEYDEVQGAIHIRFVDVEGSTHQFKLSPNVAEFVSEAMALKVHEGKKHRARTRGQAL